MCELIELGHCGNMAFVGHDIPGQIQHDFWQYGTEYWQSMLWTLWKYWTLFVEIIALPFTELCIGVVYFFYHKTRITNLVMQFLKRAPTVLFIYKFSTSMHTSRSQGRKSIAVHIEDVDLQIQIVGTKLVVVESKVQERLEEVNRNGDELRRIRLRVRGVISGDAELMGIVQQGVHFDTDSDTYSSHVQEEQDIILEMFQTANKPERKSDRLDSGDSEPIPQDDFSMNNSLYSSVNSQSHGSNDCKVKIVRVTNVYKVAYLRHFIKQKRIRKSNKQAQLRKKMEGVKRLLEDWQMSLNMVINRKMSNLKGDQVELANQEAMGDYSKPSLTSSDSECDGKMPDCDENDPHWNHQYKKSDYTFEDGDAKEESYMREYPIKNSPRLPLYVLPEETKSELAVAGSINDSDNNDDNHHAP